MIRRNDGHNVPTMSRYLKTCFPRIPVDWHMPMIVAAFSAAQKASAMHGDTLLKDDDERKEWARRALARWGHGLSAVEPRPCHVTPVRSAVDSNEIATNLLVTHEMPVSLESEFANRDVKRAFAQNTPAVENTPEIAVSGCPSTLTVDISAIMNEWGKVGEASSSYIHKKTPSQTTEIPETISDREPLITETVSENQTNEHNTGALSPMTFSDSIQLEDADDALRRELNRSLLDPLSPLLTPKSVKDTLTAIPVLSPMSETGTEVEPPVKTVNREKPNTTKSSTQRDNGIEESVIPGSSRDYRLAEIYQCTRK